MTTASVLFALLRTAVCGEVLDGAVVAACTPEMLSGVYALAKQHDLAHLAAQGLEGQRVPDCEALKKMQEAKLRAIYRYAQMEYAYEGLCQTLEAAQLDFLPLKGAVLRGYYPQSWMRTSSDIDVLVREGDLEKAVAALTERGWTIQGEVNYHDISLNSPLGVHLELHFHIRETIARLDGVLDRVWQHSSAEEGHRYVMEEGFFLFHQVAHMAYHFLDGGCGIRPFLDLWVLRRCPEERVRSLCREAGLEGFFGQVRLLAEIWFGGGVHSGLTQQMEEYLLGGGAFGNLANKTRMTEAVRGEENWLQRLILPYELLKVRYPVLNRHRWLMPIYQVVRWFGKLDSQRLQRMLRMGKQKKELSRGEIDNTKAFLSQLGLNDLG